MDEKTTSKNETTMRLVGDSEIVIERVFNAPARIVFDAWTKAELVRRWWAPKCRDVEMAGCTADVRVGGEYRYLLRNGGRDIEFYGTYSEVTPHTRLAYTQFFSLFPEAPVSVTVTFAEQGGKTRMVSHEVYPSKEAREGALSSGMEDGMRETMDQLDALVVTLL